MRTPREIGSAMLRMPSRSRTPRWLAVCLPLLAGCPVPGYTTTASVVGRIAWEDGTPASGLDVAGAQWASRGDACASAPVHVRTDSAGRFTLDGSVGERGTMWVLPGTDLAPPRYLLCANVGEANRRAYVGYGARGSSARPDSVDCVVWRWASAPRVSCNGWAEQSVVTGGRWADAEGQGFYRAFLTAEPDPTRRGLDAPYVYLQWVAVRSAAAGAPPYAVRRTVSLAFDRHKLWSAHDVRLWRRDAHWMLSIEGYKHAFMNDMARGELVFALGEPGQDSLVAGPW